MSYATIDDITSLFRELTPGETLRANALLPVVSARLRSEAHKVGKDLDAMLMDDPDLVEVAKSVTVDVVARTLMTSTDSEPLTQLTESAGGYSATGTFLVPGGGIFIKRDELSALGLRRQRYGVIDFHGSIPQGHPGDPVCPDADGC
ncbi:MAG: phage Gp19/Gp15/Gp42 family protein [Subdoligranulum sp.]|uniref:phage Gp19/Gp15/Gp42 family protein n=1 Tax=Gemmiger sp. TaxID=2049027 RepID=UPI002A910AFA|nr:phage Gp19/Gp15/Gp42 family protein [Gemmiger sp.]MDD6948285.1 phage Gp19/Gp15/Gp42 family protein [Subdoligranulum sp.]MDY5326980.1 phage Gp19/Gp15/Gp42 family protein [Gemmiger sp.]MDY6126596.1 phage Gp19/Gp15/Gp42 family protein [Gemmiger qucibialis]